MMMKITNTSAVTQRFRSNGKIVEIAPGASANVAIDRNDPALKAKLSARNVSIDDKVTEKKAEPASK